ncbi:MAG: glycosyltransferase family 2 protein [Desulfomonilia bacterium]
MTALFWGSIMGVVYAYFGYPAVLSLISLFRKPKEVHGDKVSHPRVTLIITAHNEEKRIDRKIQNTLKIDYPRDKLEVLFASDASTDATDEIVSQYAHKGIGLVRAPQRRGKEFAQKCAIEKATGDIIVFSDVATVIEQDGISKIVSNFADPTVGCVSSEDRFIDEKGNVSGEGAYVHYEMWLRSLETKVNSVVGLSGSFFAARAEVCRDWPTNIPSDFNTLLNSIRRGFRGVTDPSSVGIYTNIKDEKRELDRKVRTITRGISAFMENVELMNPLRYGIFSWQLFSHKLMRWLVPWFLIIAIFAHFGLSVRSRFYRALLIPHACFYILAVLGSLTSSCSVFVKIPFYFIQVNRAIAMAWIKFMKGERFVTWTPSAR